MTMRTCGRVVPFGVAEMEVGTSMFIGSATLASQIARDTQPLECVEACEARINSPREMSELGWFDWDDLPLPRFLAFESYLAGRCYPPHPNERVGA